MFKSVLTAQTFGAPVEVQDELNPLDGIHYTDGLDRAPAFNNRWLIARLYMNDAGTRAYFTVLNTLNPGGFAEGNPAGLALGDAFFPPIPNEMSYTGYDDFYHPALIRSYICSADVAPDGTFSNVEQFTPIAQGLNMVSDVSGDGNTLCVAHMEINEDYWAFSSQMNGLVQELCINPSVDMEQWNGYFLTYTNSGGWTQTGTIGEEVKAVHSSAYLENQAKFLAYKESEFRDASSWVPANTTINPTFEHGMFWYNLDDYVGYAEVADPAVLGAWTTCGFVEEIADFDPADPPGSYFWSSVNFTETNFGIQVGINGGPLGGEQLHKWTQGYVFSSNGIAMDTAEAYVIQEIDMVSYLFVEWKSGDYSLRGSKPHYYVFKK